MSRMINKPEERRRGLRRAGTPGGRTLMIGVKVTQEEKNLLQEKASQAGLSVQNLLLDAVLHTVTRAEKRVLTNELIGLRRTLDKHTDLDEIKATNRKINAVLDGL